MAYHEEDWAARKLEEWAKWVGDGIGLARITTNPDERMPDDGPVFPVLGQDAETTDRALKAMPVMSVIAMMRYHRAPFPSWWTEHRNLRCKRRQAHNVTHRAHHDFRSAWMAIRMEFDDRRRRYEALQKGQNPSTGAASGAFW